MNRWLNIVLLFFAVNVLGQHGVDAAPRTPQRIRVACVGDSLTYGFGLENRSRDNYPAALGRLLGNRYQVKNFGANGATLLRQGQKPYWAQRAFERAKNFAPNTVILMLGSNDCKARNWQHAAAFKTNLRQMIEAFQSLPSAPKLYLALPTPVFRDRWGVRGAVLEAEVLPKIRQVSTEMSIPLIDLHQSFQGKATQFPDGIHPGPQAAQKMAEIFAAVVAEPRR